MKPISEAHANVIRAFLKPISEAHDNVIRAFLNLPTFKQERLANALAAAEYVDPMTLTPDQFRYLSKLHASAIEAGMDYPAQMLDIKLAIARREGRHNA
jgi:hypothetical protein